jgi:hypothetical protein
MSRALDVADWLRGRERVRDVRACRVTIGKKSWEGAYYVRICHWHTGQDAVARGEHKDGEEYLELAFYVSGIVPDHKHTCYPYEGKDWYIGSYSEPKIPIKPEHEEYHPFGHSFQIFPWNVPDGTKIDTYERHRYKRIPMTVEWLEPDTN